VVSTSVELSQTDQPRHKEMLKRAIRRIGSVVNDLHVEVSNLMDVVGLPKNPMQSKVAAEAGQFNFSMRTELTSILGLAQLLMERNRRKGDDVNGLGQIHQAGRQLLGQLEESG